MNESMVTFQGWLGGDPRLRTAGEVPVTSFRVAATPRRFHRATQSWSDGPTQWYTVTAWRSLGEHCASSLRRGDPVVVHGRLTQSTWRTDAGEEVTTVEVEADFVGHDLNRGVSHFAKTQRRTESEETATTDASDASDALTPERETSPSAAEEAA